MSGIKNSYVKLRESERSRLLQSCEQVDNAESSVAERLQAAAQQFQQYLMGYLTGSETRHRYFSEAAAGTALNEIEQRYTNALRELTSRFQRQVALVEEHVKPAQRAEFIETERGYLSRDADSLLKTLLADVEQLYQTHLTQKLSIKQNASTWLIAQQQLLSLLQQYYPQALRAFPVWQQRQQELKQAEQLLQQGQAQAALTLAFQSYQQTQQLRTQLEQTQLAWEAYLRTAHYSIAHALAQCEAQETATFAFKTAKGTVQTQTEVDYWTQGQWSAVRAQLLALQQQLNQPDELNLAELQQLTKIAQQQQQQVLNLVLETKTHLLSSQLRQQIGQTIEKSLRNSGWEAIDSTYEGGDFRQALYVKFRNFQGNEMVTIVSPETATNSENNAAWQHKLSVAFFEPHADEIAWQARLKQVQQALQQRGLECTEPVCQTGTERRSAGVREALDFGQLRENTTTRKK